MPMKPIIEIKNLNAEYDSRTVLRDISLTVYDRDFLGIIGPNGGGKTTLIKCILGLLKPSSGEIIFTSSRMTGNSQLTMGYLPQYNSIDRKFPITVEEVILSGLSSKKPLTSRFTKEHREKASQVIVRMGLEGLEERAIGALSGGQLQRALLGRAIISDPEVVILDEPSTYIDKRFEARLYQLLAEINKDCAIILVSHDIGTVLQHRRMVGTQLQLPHRTAGTWHIATPDIGRASSPLGEMTKLLFLHKFPLYLLTNPNNTPYCHLFRTEIIIFAPIYAEIKIKL